MIDVTVVLVTYNHERYIAKAIESVLEQRTPRPFELIISEDASTDGTRAIVMDYAARDPRIRPLLSESNLRSNETVARGIRAARGRYICILDGDDYWIAPDKIERQAALLDSDESLAACFHNAVIVRGDAEQAGEERWTPATQATRIGFADIARGNPFAICAGMLRASALGRLGDWYSEFLLTDWPLYLLCAEQGDLLFVDEPVTAYRLHDGGQFSSQPAKHKLDMTADFYRRMNRAFRGRCRQLISAGASLFFFEWAEEYARRGERGMSRVCLAHALRLGGVGRSVPWRRWLFLAARSLG